MAHATNRPAEARRQGDSHLPRIARDLRRRLARAQRDFVCDSLRLDEERLGELAGILVEFAEDLHSDIGLWAAYERYNVDFFGTSLPLTPGTCSNTAVAGIHPDRFRHLLWVLYPALIEGLTLSPGHEDLQHAADAGSAFLREAFESVPRESGVRSLLRSPNEYGWDVKRKLIWLGTGSYLFRAFFTN